MIYERMPSGAGNAACRATLQRCHSCRGAATWQPITPAASATLPRPCCPMLGSSHCSRRPNAATAQNPGASRAAPRAHGSCLGSRGVCLSSCCQCFARPTLLAPPLYPVHAAGCFVAARAAQRARYATARQRTPWAAAAKRALPRPDTTEVAPLALQASAQPPGSNAAPLSLISQREFGDYKTTRRGRAASAPP